MTLPAWAQVAVDYVKAHWLPMVIGFVIGLIL